MQKQNLFKTFVFTIVIVLISIAGWEIYLRQKGNVISYDDNESLWTSYRTKVYLPQNKGTIFIGSSRIKFDLDINTWKKNTGTEAIQLSSVGSNPRPYLSDLAADKNFKGKLIVDVTEVLFFSPSPRIILTPQKCLEYYKKLTPAQRFSEVVNDKLESNLVFLNKDFFSLNALLPKFQETERPGIYGGPVFPIEFDITSFDRQNSMSDKFITDTILQHKVQNVWDGFRKMNKDKPIEGKSLDSVFNLVKLDIDKIKARGGQVLFVRTPSSGPYLMGEKMGYPREKYWDKLLAITQCEGIHFADYPAIDHFICPEWSHLSRPDAIIFTKNFISILQQKNWFSNNDNDLK